MPATYAHNPDFTGHLNVFGADQIYEAMPVEGNLVRQWRNKGAFEGGELVGRRYVYDVEDIAKLLILQEVCGFDMKNAALAASVGCTHVVAHALRRAPLLEVWQSSLEGAEALVDLIRNDDAPLNGLFRDDIDFQDPDSFLICANGSKWETSYDLADVSCTTIVIDLRERAERLVGVLQRFGEINDPHPSESDAPHTVATFDAPNCFDKGAPVIRHFATDPQSPLIDPTNLPRRGEA
jgi:hypothetical protein